MFWKRFIAIVALTTLVNACKPTKDYAQFGEAGQAYAQAINMLIDATEKVSIDSSYESMLREVAMTRQYGSSTEAFRLCTQHSYGTI